MAASRTSKLVYLAHTQPGFETIAAEEIAGTFADATIRATRTIPDKNGLVFFNYVGDVRDLFALRTIEDVFVVLVQHTRPPSGRAMLPFLTQSAFQASFVDSALAMARTIHPGRGGHGKLRFRVIARQVGQADYRRVDAQYAVERGIAARSDHHWRLDAQGGLEFWLTLLPGEVVIALRLSDERMRHREYKIEHLPASLRPSAAAALIWLTRPQDHDVFLDPMCGAGTLLIERACAGRYAQLLGGDSDEASLAVARANVGSRYQPITLRHWDAGQLPLDAGAITAGAVNLPFGRQIGTPEQNRHLYPVFLREAARVLRAGARLAVLTGDMRTFADAYKRSAYLTWRATYHVRLLGYPAQVIVLERV